MDSKNFIVFQLSVITGILLAWSMISTFMPPRIVSMTYENDNMWIVYSNGEVRTIYKFSQNRPHYFEFQKFGVEPTKY